MKFLIEDCVFLELKEGYIKVREILFLWYGKLYLVVWLFIEKIVNGNEIKVFNVNELLKFVLEM